MDANARHVPRRRHRRQWGTQSLGELLHPVAMQMSKCAPACGRRKVEFIWSYVGSRRPDVRCCGLLEGGIRTARASSIYPPAGGIGRSEADGLAVGGAMAQEFKACLLSDVAASLQLSRQDVNTLLTEAAVSGDGLIQYEASPGITKCTPPPPPPPPRTPLTQPRATGPN